MARLVWASLLGGLAFYCVVLALLLRSGPGSPNPALADPLRTILLVLAAGQTLAGLQATLACGTQCGSCVPELKRMLSEHHPAAIAA